MSFQHKSASDHPPSAEQTSRGSSRCLHRRRRRAIALIMLPLLVMPTLTAAVAIGDAKANVPSVDTIAAAPPIVDAAADAAAPAADAAVAAGAGDKTKFDVGTKDAPVDGKDGRPHEGPFVEVENLRKNGGSAAAAGGAATEGGAASAPAAAGAAGAVASAEDPKVYIVDGKKVPESNDGVMDDKNRATPKQGTTGTGGGVSEKDKQRKAQEGQTGERVEKTPETPKEAPPLPHHEEEKILKDPNDKADKDGSEGDVSGMGKPSNLPDKPYDKDKAIPVPGSAKKDHLDVSKPSSDKSKTPAQSSTGGAPGQLLAEDGADTIIHPMDSFVMSLTMILVSEVGDKTFLVACLMAMKHDRIVVFSAAFSALFTMTLLSAVLGHAVPSFMPKRVSNILAAALFLIFGGRMLREGLSMGSHEGVGAEMQEVEMELAEKEHQARENGRRRGLSAAVSADALEMGLGGGAAGDRAPRPQSRFNGTPNRSVSSSVSPPPRGRSGSVWQAAEATAAGRSTLATLVSFSSGLANLASLLLSPAWVQTFVMTFLGEWGDRSQIATIAMAAGQDYWWVTLGAVSGHACCTGVAVLGGRAIAGRVSLRVVTVGGAVSFLVFGLIYLVESFYQ